MKQWLTIVVCLLAGVLFANGSYAQQQLPVPQQSPQASVTQTIGVTGVTISYHRPGVKNRQIWGKLVPYNQVWRAGANENTTITFGDPVRIEGKELAAGTYGVHMIPAENEWTIIFNKNATSWGSFFYKEDEDVLRVKVKPQPGEHQEWLSYEFGDLTDSSATVTMRWEKVKVSFKVGLDVHTIVLAHAKNEYLRGLPGFTWQAFNQAAAYCMQNNVNTDEAMAWVDKSISINENFNNLRVKAGLLENSGKTAEANALKDKSMSVATEADLNTFGYQLLGNNKIKEAIDIFKKNVKAHPDSWNVYDSLGEAYDKNGETKLAVENYSKASKMVKDDANKKRIAETLKRLGAS
jgi:tetratricopeptide (TPR) repeat protein